MTLRINWACSLLCSTLSTLCAPRLIISADMPPVPAKRSRQRQSSKSMYCMSTLNRFSLAKSVVGRALKLLGTSKRLLLCLPPIILIFLVLFLCLSKGNDNFKEAYGDYLLTGQVHQNSGAL